MPLDKPETGPSTYMARCGMGQQVPFKTLECVAKAMCDFNEKRYMAAVKRFFAKAMRGKGNLEKVTMDKSGADKAAIDSINAGRNVPIVVRQVKFLNNIVEQDHRAIKQVSRPMLDFKSLRSAACVLSGMALMYMIRKGQLATDDTDMMSFPDQFYALAGQGRPAYGKHAAAGTALSLARSQGSSPAFGSGSRTCIGAALTLIDAKIVLPSC